MLHELEDTLSEFNPGGLPIEVYMPATCGWDIIINHRCPITMITGMKEILLSLRPDYVHQFRDKPKLDELLGRQPCKGPSMSARKIWSQNSFIFFKSHHSFTSFSLSYALTIDSYDLSYAFPFHSPFQNRKAILLVYGRQDHYWYKRVKNAY